jgi:HEAT repeat protein
MDVPIMILRSAAVVTTMLFCARCGNGTALPPSERGGQSAALHGRDLSRAKELYREGKRAEGAAILRDLIRNPDWSVRSQAVRTAGEVAGRELLPDIQAALRDERLEVRESAARVLIDLGDATSREPLQQALRDPAGIVRTHAAAALLRILGAEALDIVAPIATQDDDPTARAATVRAIGELHHAAAVPVLTRSLGDSSAMVRGEAADALGANGVIEAREALERAAAGDPDPSVRTRARAALQRLEPGSAVPYGGRH